LGIRATIGEKVLSNGVYCLGRGVAGLRPKPELNDRFLWHWLSMVKDQLASKGRGSTFKQVNRSDISELQIPLPSITEQRRIAAVLDKADELRAKRRSALETLETVPEAIFIEMFGNDSDNWPSHSINDLASEVPGSIRTGPFGSQLLHSEFVDDGVAVLGIDNAVQNRFVWAKPRFITPEKYQALKRFTVRPGDVLVTIMGTCGRSAIVPHDIPLAINTKHLCCISLDRDKCLPLYLTACFKPRSTELLLGNRGSCRFGPAVDATDIVS
jgi:type I restriction enzyme, S subunit